MTSTTTAQHRRWLSAAPQAPAAVVGAAVGADATLQTYPETLGTVRLQDGNAVADSSAPRGDPRPEMLRLLLRDSSTQQQQQRFGRAALRIHEFAPAYWRVSNPSHRESSRLLHENLAVSASPAR